MQMTDKPSPDKFWTLTLVTYSGLNSQSNGSPKLSRFDCYIVTEPNSTEVFGPPLMFLDLTTTLSSPYHDRTWLDQFAVFLGQLFESLHLYSFAKSHLKHRLPESDSVATSSFFAHWVWGPLHCFNNWVVTLVADKLKRQWLCTVYFTNCIRNQSYQTISVHKAQNMYRNGI